MSHKRMILFSFVILLLSSFYGCSDYNSRTESFILLSKKDCLNCRRDIPLIIELLNKYEIPITIVNENCREVEIKGVELEYQAKKNNIRVVCDKDEVWKNSKEGIQTTLIIVDSKNSNQKYVRAIKSIDLIKLEKLLKTKFNVTANKTSSFFSH